MGIKKFQLFFLGKKSIKPTKSARICPLTWHYSSPVVKISFFINKKVYLFHKIYGKKRGKWQILITGYVNVRRSFCTALNSKIFTQLVCLISPMLTRSRSCHLFEIIFVYGWIDPINKKWGKFKGQRRKVINLWWLSYVWDQLLNQLTNQK